MADKKSKLDWALAVLQHSFIPGRRYALVAISYYPFFEEHDWNLVTGTDPEGVPWKKKIKHSKTKKYIWARVYGDTVLMWTPSDITTLLPLEKHDNFWVNPR